MEDVMELPSAPVNTGGDDSGDGAGSAGTPTKKPAPKPKPTPKGKTPQPKVKSKAPAPKAEKRPTGADRKRSPGELEYGIDRQKDVPWNAKKLLVLKTLKALKATNATSAKSANSVVERSGGELTPRDVRHYCYHAKAGGLVGLADVEGVRGYGFYLTAKGAAVDFQKVAKEMEKPKVK